MQSKRPTLKRQPAYHGRNTIEETMSSTSSTPTLTLTPCSPTTPSSDSLSSPPILAPHNESNTKGPAVSEFFKLDKLPNFYYTDGNIVLGYQSPNGIPTRS